MTAAFIPGFAPPSEMTEPALWFIIQKDQLLVSAGAELDLFPEMLDPSEWDVPLVRPHYLGQYNGQYCFAGEVTHPMEAPVGWRWSGLRALFDQIDASLLPVAARALEIVEWDRSHQFCGRDGTLTETVDYERARRCPKCHTMYYPRLSPAIMVLVRRQDTLLLARGPHFKPGTYSALAGFVEPGEALEDTVAREVYEEVGILVGNLQYFGSQSWPFPHSLMLAFTADYVAGELHPDGVEIEDARWFTPGDLPELPHPKTLSRRLIDATLAQMTGKTH